MIQSLYLGTSLAGMASFLVDEIQRQGMDQYQTKGWGKQSEEIPDMVWSDISML